MPKIETVLLTVLLLATAALAAPDEKPAPVPPPAPEPPPVLTIRTGRADARVALLPPTVITRGHGPWREIRDLAKSLPSSARTVDEKGLLVLSEAPAGRVVIAVTAPGCAIRISGPRVLALGDDLHLAPRPGAIQAGRVRDAAGKPLRDARVILLEEPAPGGIREDLPVLFCFTMMTDAEGRFRFADLPAVPFVVLVDAVERGTLLLRARWPSEKVALDLRLPKPGSLGGTVRVEPDGKPVATAHVFLAPLDENPFHVPRSTKTDEAGQWRVTGLPEAGFRMIVSSKGHLFPESIRVVPRAGEDRRDVDATLRPRGGLTGRVVNIVTEPVVGADIFLAYPTEDRDYAVHDPDERKAQTDENGEFRIPNLSPDARLRVTIRAEGMAPVILENVAVTGGEMTTLPPVILRVGAKLGGSVMAAEAAETPLAGVLVVAVPEGEDARAALDRVEVHRSARTDEEGKFLIEGLAVGAYRLIASLPGRLPTITDPFEIEGAEGEPIRKTILLAAGRGVAGTVLGPDEEPIAGARVEIARADGGGETRTATTASDGTFRVTEIAPDTYRVAVSADGFAPRTMTGVMPDKPVRIVLGKPGSVRGRVVAERDGATVPPFTLTASRMVETERNVPEGATYERIAGARYRAEDGSFALVDLPPGLYRIEAVLAGGLTGQAEGVRVLAGATTSDVLIRTQRSGVLAGRVVSRLTARGVEGARVSLFSPGSLTATATALTDVDGEYRLENVPAAPMTLEVRAHDLAPVRREGVRALAGLSVRVDDVELDRGAAVRVTVRALFGGPLVGARYRLESVENGRSFSEATDETGVALFDLLRPGAYRLWSDSDEGTISAWILRVEAGPPLDVRLDPAAVVRVEGEISRLVQPVAGARVEFLSVDPARQSRRVMRTTTDDMGRYALPAMEPGEYVVRVRPTGGAVRMIPVVVPSTPVARIDLVLPEGGLLIETAAEHDGNALPGVTVIVRQPGSPVGRGLIEALSREIARGKTDARGRLALDGVPPGRYLVEAFRTGFARGVAEVAVEAGAGTIDVRVLLEAGGVLTGEVFDLRQQPIPGAFVILRDAAGRPVTLRERIPVGADGRFRIEGLATGSYVIQAEAPGHAREARGGLIVVSNSETRVDLRLQEEGRLRVSVLGLGAIPLEGATVEVLDAFGRLVWPAREDASVYRPYGVDWSTDASGEVLVTRLPAGIHVVRARYPGLKPFSIRVLVQGGAETHSAIVLLPD